MPRFGLIGLSLSHSFSKRYFDKKFVALNLPNHSYSLFELPDLANFRRWFFEQDLKGLNVTIPYKIAIIEHLDKLADSAIQVSAVNTVSLENNQLVGYNTDFLGFDEVLPHLEGRALVLGTGGASRAVTAVLQKRGIQFKTVSREAAKADYGYENIPDLSHFQIIVNTTPLGMYPHTQSCPPINYEQITDEHYGFDLVYNPEKTLFLKHFKQGQNGLAMLYAQAKQAWRIWSQQ